MRQSLLWMLRDLESTRLEVCKYPGRHGGYVRGVVSSNCEWYRQLCRNYCRPRRRYPKPRTIIRRRDTVKAIQRMLCGNTRGVYAERILDVMRELRIPMGGQAAMTRIRSLLRRCLRPLVRFAWADWLEFSDTVRVCRCNAYPDFVGVEVGGLIAQCTFMLPSEARVMITDLHAAAYQAAELIPVPEPVAA